MHRARALLSVILVLLLATGPAMAQLCAPTLVPEVDNRDGYLPPFEEHPIRPLALSSNGKELWVANIPDARVSVFDATNPTAGGGPKLIDEIGVGLGPVALRSRPGIALPRPEMWVVCTSSNSVFIVDESTHRVITTIRVEHEPADLVFSANGATAYVSLAASHQIAVIDATSRLVTQRIEFDSVLPVSGGSRLHVDEPMTLMLEGSNLYGLSHLSGNGTAANPSLCGGAPCFTGTGIIGMAQLWDVYNANPTTEPEPPDRDVVRFDVNAPAAAGTVVGWRFGTMNFDLQREPGGSDLVVSNVDLRNDELVTEQLYFKDIQPGIFEFGKPSIHRISMGPDDTSATSNQNVQHFDLNDQNNIHGALTAQGYRCSFPNQMAFNSAGDRLYVSCYGTHNVAVLDYPPTQVLAELRSGATVDNKVAFGTQGLLLDETRGVVYSFERGDGSLQVYAANPGVGTVNAPLHVRPTSIGFDITPANVEAGRFHFNNAANSAFGTDHCASCHYGGHVDGIAWDLSDWSGDIPEQTGQPLPPTDRLFPRDNKLLKVTMSLRGIEETPPFHWRGDRADLKDFGDAQVGLLGGKPLTAQQIQEIDDFIFSLSYRPNPDQNFDRSYTSQGVDGLSCFTNVLSLTRGSDTNGGGIDLSCEDCHSMAGFSGTNNEVNNDGGPGSVIAGDATQLRGMWDKETDQYEYGGPGTEPIFPVSGWGFGNRGIFDNVSQFVEAAGGGLGGAAPKAAVKAFFAEFDTGMAPTTAYAWTMDQVSVANIPQDAIDLIVAANAGHNEVIVRGWIDFQNGSGPQTLGMYRLGNSYFTDTTGVGPFNATQLIQFAQAGDAVLTFIGTPVGMGFRLGVDREMDFLLDGDESAVCPAPPAACSSHRTADTDGDLYPDGYEARFGSNPNDATSVPSGDTTAPNILSPQVAWFNTNVAKIRWTTDEESISRVRVLNSAGTTVLSTKEDLQPKWQHSQVVRGLIGGESYTVEIESEDPANAHLPGTPPNRQQVQLPLTVNPRVFLNTMHVETTQLSVRAINVQTGQMLIQATFTIHDGTTQAPLANHPLTLDFDWFEWIPGGTGAITANPQTINGTTDGQGRVSATFTTSIVVSGQSGVVEVISKNVSESVAFRMRFLPESGLHGFGAKLIFP